jgi:predicted GIY-YIG superfamily endonuclease
MKPRIYILRCADNSLYTGASSDLDHRLEQHASGAERGFTSTRLPITLAFTMNFPTMYEAAVAERTIKRWSRAKKEALIKGDDVALHELAACRNKTHHSGKPTKQ